MILRSSIRFLYRLACALSPLSTSSTALAEAWLAARPRREKISKINPGLPDPQKKTDLEEGPVPFWVSARLPFSETAPWDALMRSVCGTEWTLYSKPPFGGPQQVLKYLARYTHRVALSNHRILSLEAGRVTFRYKDYRRDGLSRTITLTDAEFTRRFLLHVLPKGFMRIRSFGLLANRFRKKNLVLCRLLLEAQLLQSVPTELPAIAPSLAPEPPSQLCPVCQGALLTPEILLPTYRQQLQQRSRAP